MSALPTQDCFRWLDVGAARVRYASIKAVLEARGCDPATLPYAIRVLVENIARHRKAGGTEAGDALSALARWPRIDGTALPLFVSRVILPDSSGLPVLLDLAALRDALARGGRPPGRATPQVPIELIVDHSLQVDYAGRPDAAVLNLAREFDRNDERYRFLKWAQAAFPSLRVFPPGTGIIHQVNLEHLASVVTSRETGEGTVAFPDFVIGGDSHTPMVNGLGVLGWGVGGLDAEAILLGQPHTIPLPKVIGVRLTGALPAGSTTTDLALLVTQRLRQHGVTGRFVEYFGEAATAMTVPERATLANMAPEYGATVGFFPVDDNTLAYLRATGRSDAQLALVEVYCRANLLFRDADAPTPHYTETIEIDLATAVTTLAGPKRPQERRVLSEVAADFRARLERSPVEDGYGVAAESRASPKDRGVAARVVELNHPMRSPSLAAPLRLSHGAVVIAAITSCTNTSNPSVMIAAGLVARNAVARGLQPPAWVKRSLAPGSQVVTRYLDAAGLLAPLEALGFHVVGYGCTTCGGKSGPLDASVAEAIERDGLVVATVLSGNRNFEGRIHRLARANYLGSPPLVVAYALAGRIDIDLTREPLGVDRDGRPVFLANLWPHGEEIAQHLAAAADPALYRSVYADAERGPDPWRRLSVGESEGFAWDPASSYIVPPPFVDGVTVGDPLPERLDGARVLAAFGDMLTTDHISPGGEIPAASAAGRYLAGLAIAPKNFNSYVGRRCNHEVMVRGTFANVRIRNQLLPEVEGGVTRKFPGGATMDIHAAADAYRAEGVPLLVLAGKDYGTGSSRDWAAKGTALLGVRAVLAESFERIHRANLVSMGVVPLRFADGEGWSLLGLSGEERFTLSGLRTAVLAGGTVAIVAEGPDGTRSFSAVAEIHTEAERRMLADGGLLPSVFKRLQRDSVATT